MITAFSRQTPVKVTRRQTQAGLTTIGLVVTIAVAAVTLTCLLKMGPVYIQSWNVQEVLDSILEEQSTEEVPFTKGEIRSLLNKRFSINQIRIVEAGQFDIERTAEGTNVSADYEVRSELLGNVDVVMKFNSSVVLPVN